MIVNPRNKRRSEMGLHEIEAEVVARLRRYEEAEGSTVLDGVAQLLAELFERVQKLEEDVTSHGRDINGLEGRFRDVG